MKVDGLKAVKTVLEDLIDEAKADQVTYVVGYTQRYALPVHERPTSKRSAEAGKSNKYLEGPARREEGNIARIVGEVYQQTKSMDDALMIAGLHLQRVSQEIVPIDTGALRTSAFTCPEDELEEVAQAAYAAGEARRSAVEATRNKEQIKKSTAAVKRRTSMFQREQKRKLKALHDANKRKARAARKKRRK